MTSAIAFKQFSLENDMQDVDEETDSIYIHNTDEQKRILEEKPWSSK